MTMMTMKAVHDIVAGEMGLHGLDDCGLSASVAWGSAPHRDGFGILFSLVEPGRREDIFRLEFDARTVVNDDLKKVRDSVVKLLDLVQRRFEQRKKLEGLPATEYDF